MSDNPLELTRLFFIGNTIVLSLHGVFFTLSIVCLHYLLSKPKWNWIILGYIVASVVFSTIFMVASTKTVELVVLGRALSAAALLSKLDILQRVMYSLKIWLADGLLIYRLWVIWGGNFVITIFPCILFIGTFAIGIAGLALFPQQVTKVHQITVLGVAFHVCSVALNLIATSLIAGRLLYHRANIRQLGGDDGRVYLTLSAVFAESGALYSTAGVIYIPLYAINSPLIYAFAGLLEAASGIAPALILLRMALGVSIERNDTRTAVSSVNFKKRREEQKAESSMDDTLSTFAAAPGHSAISFHHQTPDTSRTESTYQDSEK